MMDLEKCNFCRADIYVKTRQYLRPVLAPITQEAAIEQELIEKTGWRYIMIQNNYCPMCGKKVGG